MKRRIVYIPRSTHAYCIILHRVWISLNCGKMIVSKRVRREVVLRNEVR